MLSRLASAAGIEGFEVLERVLASDTSTWVALLVLFVLMAIPLGPAEPTAVVAGLMVGSAMAPIVLVVLILAVGMTIGDLIAFRIGGPVHRRISRRPRGAAWLAAWQHQMSIRRLWGDAAVAGLRFVPGARTPSALAARSTGMSTIRFCLLAATGSLVWAAAWVGLSGAAASLPGGLGAAAGLLVLTVAVVLLIWRRRGGAAAR